MDKKMFCYQCEQTAGCVGCTGNFGVCGKSSDTSKLQDELTGALIGLAYVANNGDTNPTDSTYKTVIEGLFTTFTNVNFNNKAIRKLIEKVHKEKEKLIHQCNSFVSPYGRNNDYNMDKLWLAQEYSLIKVFNSVWYPRYGSICTSCNDTWLCGLRSKQIFL